MKRSALIPWMVVAALATSCSGSEPPPAFVAQNAWDHMAAQCEFGPRVPGTTARDSAAAYITGTLQDLGARVSVQAFDVDDPYADRRLRLFNIIASFEPDRERRVMLCAHYDSRPWADQDPDTTAHNTPILGAVDGAASVGVLLEMGRLISTRPPDGIGIDLVFFDGEDYGKKDDLQHYLLGSKHFAVNMAGYRPVCALLLDMVGGAGSRVGREGYSLTHAKALVDTLWSRAAAMELDYFIDVNGAPIYDDHVPLLQTGIKAANIFGYDYTYWHTLADTPDKCETGKLDQVGRLLVDFLYRFPFGKGVP